MRTLLLIAACALSACAATSFEPRAEPAAAKLPTIPQDGWAADESEHRSWHRGEWQIADYNRDGRIDYLRIPDPPFSYNHRIWIDNNCDGYFDTYSDATSNDRRTIRIRVPDPLGIADDL